MVCWDISERDGITNQSIEPYQINENLHDMIRNSPHNTRKMFSTIEDNECDTESGSDDDDDIFDSENDDN